MGQLMSFVTALVALPFFLTIALVMGLLFGLLGGIPGGVIAAWPPLLYYHDRFLMGFIPPRWTRDGISRIEEYVRFYRDM
jgi:hypothetical protein